MHKNPFTLVVLKRFLGILFFFFFKATNFPFLSSIDQEDVDANFNPCNIKN